MRALTVRQPWATLIALGIKRYETRSRPTKVRGRIAIHAGLAMPCRSGQRVAIAGHTVEYPRGWQPLLSGGHLLWPEVLPFGAVIATATLVSCEPTPDVCSTWQERQMGDWMPGRWAWRLADVEPLPHAVPARGRQGWWDWTADLPESA